MAEPSRIVQGYFSRMRLWFGGLVSRVIRRGFFRIVLGLFLLLVVAPLAILNLAANRGTANWLLDSISQQVFDTQLCEVSWDRDRTEIRGPGVVLAGAVTFHDLRVKRRSPLTHSSGHRLEYEFVRVPRVVIHYDLKRLPQIPVTGVELPERIDLYFNIDKGRWMDADLFRPGDDKAEAPALPQIIVREAMLRLRADGVLAPPEEVAVIRRNPADRPHWYEMRLSDLAMLPNRQNPENLDLSGSAFARPFGGWVMGGSILRDSGRTEVLFAQRGLALDRGFVSALGAEVRSVYDQFQIQGMSDISCRLVIERDKPLNFSSEISIYDGSMCYVGFPGRVSPARGKLRSVNNNVYIDEIRGKRGSASVVVDGSVTEIGVVGRETVKVNVRIADLLVDENFRLALLEERLQPDNADPVTGLPYPADQYNPGLHRFSPGYPEWPGASGDEVYPDLPDILPFVCRGFTPIGLCNFDLSTTQVFKGMLANGERRVDKNMRWRVFVRDASASFTGLPEWGDEGGGFALPMYQCYGVVEGVQKSGQAGRFIVRGYTEDELAAIPGAERRAMVVRPGLVGERGVDNQRVLIRSTYTEAFEGRPPELVLNVTTEGFVFDDEVQRLLPAEVRAAVHDFAPRGRADVERATITVRPGQDRTDYEFDIKARDVLAQYQLEGALQPLEMSQIAGNLRVESRGGLVRLTAVQGLIHGSPVGINLTFRRQREQPEVEFDVRSTDFRLTQNLRLALPPALVALFDAFKPTGNLNLRVSGVRNVSGRPDLTEADVTVSAGGVMYERFPYPMTAVSGRVLVTMREDSVEVLLRRMSATGSEPETQVNVSGRVFAPLKTSDDDNRPVRVDLALEAARVRPDAALLQALTPILSQLGGEPGERPAAVKFIENLRIEGMVGVTGRLASNEQGELDWDFEISLEGCGVNFTGFPYPISQMSGAVLVRGRDITLRNCRGIAEGGEVRLHEARYNEAEGWLLSLEAFNMPFTRALRDALPQALARQFDRSKPVGRYDLQLEISGKDDAMWFAVAADLKNTDLELGLRFDDCTARVDAEGAIVGDSTEVNARLYVKEAFFKKARFNDLTSRVQLFGDRLSLPNLRGRFYGGTIEAALEVAGSAYDGALVVRGADLKELGRTAFPEAGELAGALDAEVKFYSAADKDGQIGRGRVDVAARDIHSPNEADRQCKLAAVPLFSEMFATTKNPQNFDEGHVYFWLGPDRITIREMDFISDAARVETFGPSEENYIMYSGGGEMRLKLFFTLAPRAPLAIPGLQQVFDLLKQILFPLYVTGSLNAPKVEPFSLGADELERRRETFPRPPKES